MELDLDSFLNSSLHDADDDEDEILNSFPHRTVEEILKDSLSGSNSDSDSDAPSSASPPSVVQSNYTSQHLEDDDMPNKSTAGAPQRSPRSSSPLVHSNYQSKSETFALLRHPPDRQLPSLFGGVRSTAKPGVALAAAAAASRTIPTPHAAAIKSRRALPRSSVSDATNQLQSSSASFSNEISLDPSGLFNDRLSNDDVKLPIQQKDDKEGEDVLKCNEDIGHLPSTKGDSFNAGFLPQEGVVAESQISDEVEMQEQEKEKEGISLLGQDLSTPATSVTSIANNEDELHLVTSAEQESTITSAGRETGAHVTSSVSVPDEKGAEGQDEATSAVSESKDNEAGFIIAEVDELVEERIGQLESKRNKEKEPQKTVTLKPLELAEQAEKRQASNALHWEEGAAAQPMRLEGVRRGSTTLGYFDVEANNTVSRTISAQAFRCDHGSPQVLAVHTNSIAIGMSKGIIILVPSKYSPHHPDNMEAKMTMLGLQGERSYAAVTAMSFNQQGDLLLAGYGDGHVTVWDVQRTSIAKVITGEHTAPVVHAFFLGQDSQVTRQFKTVTGDSNGLVLLHSFSVVLLLNRFSVKTQCLLDGLKTGTVLSASPLIYDEVAGGTSLSPQGSTIGSSSSIGSMVGGVVGGDAGWKLFNEGTSLTEEGVVIFVTYQTALVVRLSPALKVYASLSKPEGVREGSMPYTAWKCTSTPSSSSNEKSPEEVAERVSLLAIAWDRKVQVAKLVNSELKVYGKWSLDSAAIGVAWLDDQMLIVLTVTAQICLFARDGSMIHQTSFAVDSFRGDDLITYHTQYINVFGNPEKAYHNSVAVRGASVYILGPTNLVVSRLLPWKERIQVLRKAGDWMGALNMAMTLYDGQAHGVIDLPRTLDAVQDVIMPYLVELLLSYVDEVFSYISVAFANQIGKIEQVDGHSGSSSVQNEIKEQFARVGGVAVEFCVHIKRTDILFEEIFSKFVAVQHRETFLELLEPYILKDMLSSLPPEIMQALVEHYSSKGWLQRVEQCVLHMDISSLDFNQVVRLCREHGLYCALVYLFNRGLNDFRSPLEELLVVFQNSQRESAAALGYKMLVYLKYCFCGLAFPPGHGTLPAARLPSLRTELVQFLLEDSGASISSRSGAYINMYHLLELDTEATLQVVRCAFVDEVQNPGTSSLDSANQIMKMENGSAAESMKLIQDMVNALIHVLDMEVRSITDNGSNGNKLTDVWPSSNDIGHLYEFIAYFVAAKEAKVSKDVLTRILEHLISEPILLPGLPEQNVESFKRKEKQVLSLLEIVPKSDWDAAYVLQLCEKALFHQVCGFIHTIQDHYLAALDNYMKDADEPVHAFAFINSALSLLNETERSAFREAVITRIPGLVDLCREGAFFLVVNHFDKESQRVLSVLQSYPSSFFLYLKTVIEVHLSGTLDFSHLKASDTVDVVGRTENAQTKRLKAFSESISDFPRFLRSNPVDVTDDMIEHYLELLCQYDRNSVLKFLETFDSYRVEHCLRLCQDYGITDAAAFLLERVGDVGSALLLTLSSLNDKFTKLEAVVNNVAADSDMTLSDFVGSKYFNALLNIEEIQDILRTLHACVGLCQRNTPRLNPEESEILWFRLLDSVCEPLMDLSNGKIVSEDKGVGMMAPLGSDGDEIIKWRISKSDRSAHTFRKLFSHFIKEIVEGMIGYVRLPVIMSKLLSDNGSQEFGDFKLTILGMLGTYGFERRILDTAKSLIEYDTFYTMSLLRKGASHGYARRILVCCICSCPLSKNSSTSGVQIFNCGHATHVQCKLMENGTSSNRSSMGCPVCSPKKSDKGKSKSPLGENGLVSNKLPPSRRGSIEGMNVLTTHENHSDTLDSSYSVQQLSRFDMLTVLQKDRAAIQIENLPPLRLAPPAVYHEKVKKGIEFLTGETSNDVTKNEKPSKRRQLKELKVKGSSLRFPLKSSIFGKERTSR